MLPKAIPCPGGASTTHERSRVDADPATELLPPAVGEPTGLPETGEDGEATPEAGAPEDGAPAA